MARPVCAGGAAVCIQYNAGDTFIDGWTVVVGSVDLVGTAWLAAAGVRSLDLNGTAAGVISQIFDTLPGTLYEVRFDVAGNVFGGPAIKNARATAGATTYDFSFNITGHTGANMGWTEHLFMFTAAGPGSTLTFTSLTGGSAGIALDNVRLSAVPLPASLPLFVAALVGMARRRKRTSNRTIGTTISTSAHLVSASGVPMRRTLAIILSVLLVFVNAVWAPPASAAGTVDRKFKVEFVTEFGSVVKEVTLDPRGITTLHFIEALRPEDHDFRVVGETDPYFAFRLDVTNTSATPRGFLINVFSPMVPVLDPLPGADPAMFTVLSTTELFDANGNGSASFGSLDVGFGLSNSAPSAGSGPLIPPRFTTFDEPELQTIFDVGPAPVPASPVGQWDTMTYFINGFFGPLSPGDRVVLNVFGCVALPDTTCPAPPDLSTVVPLPAAMWLLAPGLAGLLGVARRRTG